MRTLCLGEAIVDLVCERPVAGIGEAESFVPHFGGTAANIAVAAAQTGADVALAGGAGDDDWGRWLRERLAAEGVDVQWFELVSGVATPVAFVISDAAGEPSFQIYADSIEAGLRSVEPRLEEALGAGDALCLGSNTLVGESARELTLRARERALEAGMPVVFDPNVRMGRWGSAGEAAAAANACVPGAFLVRANAAEASLLTGEADPDAAAQALVQAGARMAIVTLGASGGLLRGELSADVAGVQADVRSTVGAGDAFTGVLVGRLGQSGYYPPVIPASLREAVREAAKVTERWSAAPAPAQQAA